MNYIYLDVNQWDLLVKSLDARSQALYEPGAEGTPTHKGKPVIMLASYYRGEQQTTVSFVREAAL